MTTTYHSSSDLFDLGKQVYHAAVKATVEHEIGGSQRRTWMQGAYGHIPTTFASYGYYDPAIVKDSLNPLWGVAAALHPGLSVHLTDRDGHLTNPIPVNAWSPNVSVQDRTKDIITTHLASWHGNAADSFRSHFVNHIDTAATNQSAVAGSLALVLDAHERIRECANQDMWLIGQHTVTALDSIGDSHPKDVKTALSVFAAVASVLAAIPTGGASLGVAVLGLGSAVTPSGSDKKNDGTSGQDGDGGSSILKIGGGTVAAVLADMRHAITSVNKGIDSQEQTLVRLLGTMSQHMDSLEGKGTLEIPAPADVRGLKGDSASQLRNQDPDNPDSFYDR